MGKSLDIRFMNRVFTPDERERILKYDKPDVFLWMLWAGKETGYKAISKLYPSVSSSPGYYEVELSGKFLPEYGIVNTPCGPVSVRFVVSADYVHCIGSTEGDTDHIVSDIQTMDRLHPSSEYESYFVRKIARKSISDYFGINLEDVEIIRPIKDDILRPPVAYIEGRKTDISMSHDNRFAACAFGGLSL
jgi:hypothetical protein